MCIANQNMNHMMRIFDPSTGSNCRVATWLRCFWRHWPELISTNRDLHMNAVSVGNGTRYSDGSCYGFRL